MTDLYEGMSPGLLGPYIGGFAITPGTTVFAQPTRALFVGGAGSLVLTCADGSSVTLTGVLAGALLPIRVTSVLGTSTATNIAGLY